MKQVFLRSGNIEIDEICPPVCDRNEILVANAYSAISVGTEVSTIESRKDSILGRVLRSSSLMKKALGYVRKKGIKESISKARKLQEALVALGYSSAGVVIEVGNNITDINIGDRVACAGGGKASHAEVVAVPRNLVASVPNTVSFEEAAFTTLGAIAMHGIRRAERQLGETIVIFGVGLIGQLAVQIAKAGGYGVIAVDKNPERVNLAKRMGADVGLVAGKDDIEKEVLAFTNGMWADAVIICAATSSSKPVNMAMGMTREKGKVVVVGDVGMKVKREVFYEKELDFLISRSYGPGRYDPLYEEKGIDYPVGYVRWTENRNMRAFLDLLAYKKVDLKPLIEAVFSVREAVKAYELVAGGKRPLGVLLKYDPSKYIAESGGKFSVKRIIEIEPRFIEGKVDVALVGAGSFAKGVALPILTRIREYNLKAIATASGINAKQTASKYKAEYCTTDYKEVLEDENIDLLIITTPHNLHCQMIIDAAKAGKAIYVEKPMCLTEAELSEIVKVISRTKVPLVVGFNRRYSPLATKAKELLRQKHGPYLINYRVNAGFIPRNHWVQDPEVGGGRIVGECCHFFDFFNYIIESEVENILAMSIPVNNSTVIANDNVIAAIKWRDGSLTTLTYTALGDKNLPKERIEIYSEGNSLVIDDFKRIELYGFDGKRRESTKRDKGHHQELVELAKFLKGEESNLITFEECVTAMKVTFEVQKLVKSNVRE